MEMQGATASKRRFPLPRWLPWSHGLVLAVTLSFWGMFLLKGESLGYVYKRDFLCVYIGARAVVQGQGARLYDAQLQWKLTDSAISPYRRSTLLPFVYPAYVAILFAPLGKISLVRAFLIWTGINVLVIGWLIRQLIQYRQVVPAQRTALLLAFLAWVPMQLTLSQGQMGLICTLAVSEAALSLEHRKEWAAGCWLAVGLVKPQLIAVPLLGLFLLRSWRAVASFLTIACAVFCASCAVVGFWIPDYLRFLTDFNRGGKGLSMYPMAMQNWRGLVAALLSTAASTTGHWLLIALSGASLLLVVVVFWGHGISRTHLTTDPASRIDSNARLSIAVLVGLLVSPHLYFHDWVVAFPALALLFVAATEWSRQKDCYHWLTIAILWLIALSPLLCFAVQFGVWPTNTRIQLVPWYMGVLTIIAAVRLRVADKQVLAATV